MAPATDGKKEIVFSREIYRADHIRRIRATRDQARLLVDHRIIDFASIIVIRVTRLDHAASQLCLQLSDGIRFQCFLHRKLNKESGERYSSEHNGRDLKKGEAEGQIGNGATQSVLSQIMNAEGAARSLGLSRRSRSRVGQC